MAAVAQQLGARVAGDVLHHDEVLVVALVEAEVEHLDDVRVHEPRGGERLAAEARDERRVVGQVLGEQLHRDVALEPLVEREVHGRHAADAEAALEPVAACDRRRAVIVRLPVPVPVAGAAGAAAAAVGRRSRRRRWPGRWRVPVAVVVDVAAELVGVVQSCSSSARRGRRIVRGDVVLVVVVGVEVVVVGSMSCCSWSSSSSTGSGSRCAASCADRRGALLERFACSVGLTDGGRLAICVAERSSIGGRGRSALAGADGRGDLVELAVEVARLAGRRAGRSCRRRRRGTRRRSRARRRGVRGARSASAV